MFTGFVRTVILYLVLIVGIRLMGTIKTRYKITVRTKPVNISFPPGEYCLSSLPKFCAKYSLEKSREKDFEKITDASCIV